MVEAVKIINGNGKRLLFCQLMLNHSSKLMAILSQMQTIVLKNLNKSPLNIKVYHNPGSEA